MKTSRESPIPIQLRWGNASYFLKERAIEGKLLDGTDFRIEKIDPARLGDWIGGAFIQVAFPDLSAGQHELLMSGVSEKESDAMFGEGGDEVPADPDIIEATNKILAPDGIHVEEPRWPAERRVPRS